MNEGTASCELLTWDTDFFGFRIARLTQGTLTRELAESVDAWCHQNRIRCLYFLARSDDIETTRWAERFVYRLVDVRLTLECKPSQRLDSHSDMQLRVARPDDIAALQLIASESHTDSRFFYDDGFPRASAQSLYETWIKRSVEGYAQTVLVALEQDDSACGYVTCHLDRDSPRGQIGLVGVSSLARGKGVGRALVTAALGRFSEEGALEVEVVTQGRNAAAQRLYQRSGFVTRRLELWYHKWFTPEDDEID